MPLIGFFTILVYIFEEKTDKENIHTIIMERAVVDDGAGKYPFILDRKINVVNDSSVSAQTNDNNTLLPTPQTKSIRLCNYQTGQSIDVTDPLPTIYQDCRHHVCTSTLVSLAAHAHKDKSWNEQTPGELESTSLDYIRNEAHNFLSIYHNDKNTIKIEYEKRLDEIDFEIKQTGTYTHTTDEIEYGCQLAWRNAARCINRLYWRTLKVIDRRHLKTNDEIFKEVCDHIRLAFNNGTLQATTLVLSEESRLWSTQYLRYACYEQADGLILGDPMNRELTKVAMKLGWNKSEQERTQWDLLPIIVQCNPNVSPSWYDLPQDLRPQVFLSHPDPKYDEAIKSLGLRWVAQPFVSDKAIEIGGIVYRCVPFSGWFMQTEVGRNLCDLQRYNFIPKLAALLNLDITAAANSQLNIDRLYLEINTAVIHSFERAKVAIVDHHTAAAGFMIFMKQEVKERGNTPGDWIWLVPPLSGGMSVLFHQEMLNYVVKPRVFDQPDPWTYYAPFLRNKHADRSFLVNKYRRHWLMLRGACTIISFALKVMKRRILVNVLYASATGTAKSYAQQMTKRLMMSGYKAKLMELDSYLFQQNTKTRSIVLIITSTFGQGNAPEGGKKIEQWLQKEMNVGDDSNNNNEICTSHMDSRPESNRTRNNMLQWCTYAVCAIGSSAYSSFCGFGKLVDMAFELLGANRLVPFGACDTLNQQYKSFNEWEELVVMTLNKMYPHAGTHDINRQYFPVFQTSSHLQSKSFVEEQMIINESVRPSYISLEFYPNTHVPSQSEQIKPFTKENPFTATVLRNIELTGIVNVIGNSFTQEPQKQYSLPKVDTAQVKKLRISSKFANINNDKYHSVRLITFDTTDLSYDPGDHVCILPENTSENVNAIILACGWKLGNKLLNAPCSLTSCSNGIYKTMRQILTHFVDLTSTPRPHTLNTIATYAIELSEQRQIAELGKGGQEYADWLVNLPTVKETLEQFPSIRIPLHELIQVQMLPYILTPVLRQL